MVLNRALFLEWIKELIMDKYTVTGTDGSIDISASAAKYASVLTAWVTENEINPGEISSAINTVLGTSPNGRVAMPRLLNETVMKISSNPDNFSVMQKRVHAYITGQSKAGKLFIVKGKGGGVTAIAPTKKTA
jgi:hypothetical protein